MILELDLVKKFTLIEEIWVKRTLSLWVYWKDKFHLETECIFFPYNDVPPHTSQNGHCQKNQTINAGEDVEKREPSCTVGENVNWSSHYGCIFYGRCASLLLFHGVFTFCVFAKSLQSCLTLCDPLDCSLPGSSVHGILQAWTLEWVAMPSFRGSSRPRDQPASLLSPAWAGRFFTTRPPEHQCTNIYLSACVLSHLNCIQLCAT